jgi:hypothetical protein
MVRSSNQTIKRRVRPGVREGRDEEFRALRSSVRLPLHRSVGVVRVAVEQVIQTASKVLRGEFTSREAITILATLTREAVPAARELRATDPDRADTYRELIVVIGRELRGRADERNDARYLRAVIEDLAKVLRALE